MKRNPHKASRVNKGPDADDRFTPRYLIEALHKEFKFTVDIASHHKAPASEVIGAYRTTGGLEISWASARVFCNPPFSNIPAWVWKAQEEVRMGCRLVVMLLPWNRQEQPWWQGTIEPLRDGRGGGPCRITTLALGGGQYGVNGRVKYGTPADPEGKRPHNSPSFGSGLVIWRGN